MPTEPTGTTTDSLRKGDSVSLRAGIRQAWGWAVMFGAGENSFGLFGARLLLPRFFFGLLTGVPQFLGPLAQVLAANLVDRSGKRKHLVTIAVVLQIVCFLPLLFLPVYCLAGPPLTETSRTVLHVVLVVAVSLYCMCGHFTSPPWSSLISDVVPSSMRGPYFARASRDTAALTLVSQMVVGGALYLAGRNLTAESQERWTMWVFAGAFAVAVLARVYSLAQIRKLQELPYASTPETVFTFWQFIRRAPESNFVHFVLFTALINFGTYLTAPYFLPYWTYDLGHSVSEWVVLSTAATLASIVTLLFWGRFSERFGTKKTLYYTSFGVGIIPLLWVFSANFYYLLCVNMFSGAVWAGFGLSCWNYILEAVSAPKRARCVAYFNVVCGTAMIVGSLAGGWIEPILPRVPVGKGHMTAFISLLLVSTVCRLTAAAALLPTFKELRQVTPFSLRHWFYRITAVRYPVGIILEYLGNEDEDGNEQDDKKE